MIIRNAKSFTVATNYSSHFLKMQFLSCSFQPKTVSQISFIAALTPGLHLHSWNIAPRTNFCPARMFNASQTPITAVFRYNTNTTCFCLPLPISSFSDALSKFLPLQSWSPFIILSIVLILVTPVSPQSYTWSVPILHLYNIFIRSITSYQFLLPFS